ncbi:hypothetical protein [Cupriavidus necator]
MLGCDLAYMGTKFIATRESMVVDGYKDMLIGSELDDVLLSRAFTGGDQHVAPLDCGQRARPGQPAD